MISLVSGGAGFIGSHLCDFLISQEHQVICLDNLITGHLENIRSLLENPAFQFINTDITQPLPTSLPKVDWIFHLASPASPNTYIKYSFQTIFANTQGTYQLLEYARQNQCKFLFASTSEIYGSPLVHPQPESYWGNVHSYGPRACYDESKRLGESLIYEFISKFNVDARIIRIFNTYGPRLNESDGRVVSNFIVQALKSIPISIYGDGSQTRSFCYISDLISGIWAAMRLPKTQGEIFNLGNPTEISIKNFAQLVLKLVENTQSKIIFKPLPIDDPICRKPDIAKANRQLNWEPSCALEKGLIHTIQWYKSRVS
jgi:nucleoside-diphosphate-sugar epimerase